MKRFNRPPMLFMALLLACLAPVPCSAQTPAPSASSEQPQLPQGSGMQGADAIRAGSGAPLAQFPDPGDRQAGPPSHKSSLEYPPVPGGEVLDLKLPPAEPGDLRFPINLATALRLADARPIIVSAAGASVWVAESKLQKAAVLWLPSLNLGGDYIRHDGYGPDLNRGVNIPQGENALGQNSPGSLGKPLNQNINYFYGGGGFTYLPLGDSYFYQPMPGVPLLPEPQFRYLADEIFEPLKEKQMLNSARWDIQTAKNDALLMTATAYFAVHKFRGQYAVSIDAVRRGRKLVAVMAELSRDLIPAAEIDRARNLLADLEQQAVTARQMWRIVSADLTRILRLDPRAVCEPLEHDHLQVTLIDPQRSLDDLMPIALTNRPELASHQALIQATLVSIRQEKLRPFLPSALFNGFQSPYELIEVGGYGIGNGGKMNIWSGRDDVSMQFLTMADGMGLRNLAWVKQARGMSSQAIVQLFQLQDSIAADVTRTQADLQSAAARIVQAEREVRSALINYNGNVEGLSQTKRFGNVLVQVVRPWEAVFSLQLLMRAYDNYITTVAEYNTSQFALFHALGYPARDVEFLRPPGEILPVNTTRPSYLPPVGTGPPPATR
jgi:outer membrane protein TolC